MIKTELDVIEQHQEFVQNMMDVIDQHDFTVEGTELYLQTQIMGWLAVIAMKLDRIAYNTA